MIELPPLPSFAFEAWTVVFALAEDFPDHWVLVGGQMVALHAAEHQLAESIRPTNDVDVIVNIRARGISTHDVATWLTERGLQFDGASPDNIGHRYTRAAEPGPGTIVFDVLAPEGVGSRADLTTTPPARTIEVPGGTQSLARAETVQVTITNAASGDQRSGNVRRPSLLGALVGKAVATTIAVRNSPDSDWQDAALLLVCVENPFDLMGELTPKDRTRLEHLAPLADAVHVGWALLNDGQARRGRAALEILTTSQI